MNTTWKSPADGAQFSSRWNATDKLNVKLGMTMTRFLPCILNAWKIINAMLKGCSNKHIQWAPKSFRWRPLWDLSHMSSIVRQFSQDDASVESCRRTSRCDPVCWTSDRKATSQAAHHHDELTQPEVVDHSKSKNGATHIMMHLCKPTWRGHKGLA